MLIKHTQIFLSLFFIIIGLLIYSLSTVIIDFSIQKALELKIGSATYEPWRKVPGPLYLKVYFWNWTNPEDISEHNYKPNLVEMGPYTFREIGMKVNLTWHDNNSSVTFRRIKHYWFEAGMSNGTLDDQITTLNVIATTCAHMYRHSSSWMLYPVSAAMAVTGQKLHWTHSVRELTFEGLENGLQQIGNTLPGLSDFAGPTDRFGWFYKENDTLSRDVYNINTGRSDISRLGQLNWINYDNSTHAFTGSCSVMNGSYGELWGPRKSKNDILQIQTPEMCRNLKYFFTEEVQHKDTLVYKYSITERTLDNGGREKLNMCYCSQEQTCLPSGVYNRSGCSHGAPMFMSFPHFLFADTFYKNKVDGMRPDNNLHGSYIKLDPFTGIQLETVARFQINVLLQKRPGLTLFKNVPEIYFPILWAEETLSLPENLIDVIKLANMIPGALTWSSVIMILTSLLLIARLTVRKLLNNKKRAIKHKPEEIVKLKCGHQTNDTDTLGEG